MAEGCFAVQPPDTNGSHLDMLHASPWGMGIAHEVGHAYWVFNGQVGSLDRYDFKTHDGPGNEDHSDGELRRYAAGLVRRTPNVPSHMVFNHHDGHLYVADTGNARIVKLDAASGTPSGPVAPVYEPYTLNELITGAVLSEVVSPGRLVAPSGLELHDDLLYVTDSATSRIHAFDLDGVEVRFLDTGLPPGSLAGLTIGPDGKAYFVAQPTGIAYRIDPR